MQDQIDKFKEFYPNSMYTEQGANVSECEASQFLSDIFTSIGLHRIQAKLKRKESHNIRIACLIDGTIESCASIILTYLTVKKNIPGYTVDISWSGTECVEKDGSPNDQFKITILPIYVVQIKRSSLLTSMYGEESFDGGEESFDGGEESCNPVDMPTVWLDTLFDAFNLSVGDVHSAIHIVPDSPSMIPSNGTQIAIASVLTYKPDVIITGNCVYDSNINYSKLEESISGLSGEPIVVGAPLAFVTISDMFSILDTLSEGRLSDIFYIPEELYNTPLVRLPSLYSSAVIAFVNSNLASPNVRFLCVEDTQGTGTVPKELTVDTTKSKEKYDEKMETNTDMDVTDTVGNTTDGDTTGDNNTSVTSVQDVTDGTEEPYAHTPAYTTKVYPIEASLNVLREAYSGERNPHRKDETINLTFNILKLRGIN